MPSASTMELTLAESFERLRGEAVGRICIDVGGYPIAMPINYLVDDTLDGPRIAVRTAPSTEIGSCHGRASLEVARFDLAAGWAWSVIVEVTCIRWSGDIPMRTRTRSYPIVGPDGWS